MGGDLVAGEALGNLGSQNNYAGNVSGGGGAAGGGYTSGSGLVGASNAFPGATSSGIDGSPGGTDESDDFTASMFEDIYGPGGANSDDEDSDDGLSDDEDSDDEDLGGSGTGVGILAGGGYG